MEPQSVDYSYSLDPDEHLSFSIPLQLNEAAAEELGPGKDFEDNAVYEEEFLGFYCSIRLQPLLPVKLQSPDTEETKDSRNVFAMVFDLTFHSSKPHKYRYRNAEVSVAFASLAQERDSKSCQPAILAFAPQAVYGRPAATVKKGNSFSFELTSPVWNVAKGGVTRSSEVERQGRFSMLGSPRGSPVRRIVWGLNEGEGTHSGLPLSVKNAILISVNDPFKVCFDIDTDVGFLPEVARTPSKLARTVAAMWSGEVSTTVSIDPQAVWEKRMGKGFTVEVLDVGCLARYTSFTGSEKEQADQ